MQWIAPRLAYSLIHRQQILDRRLRLDVVDCVEDVAAARPKDADALRHLGAHLVGRAIGQRVLRIDAAAPEDDTLAKLPF